MSLLSKKIDFLYFLMDLFIKRLLMCIKYKVTLYFDPSNSQFLFIIFKLCLMDELYKNPYKADCCSKSKVLVKIVSFPSSLVIT